MGWTDKLGDAWDSAKDWALDDSLTKPSGSAIGAAYAATSDSIVGDAIGAVGKFVGGALMDTATALSYPLHQVKHGLGAGFLMSDRAEGVGLFDASAWSKAWDQSETNSIGQMFDTGVRDTFGIGTASPDSNASLFEGRFLGEKDPYSGENAKKQQEFYKGTWEGRLTSGAVDVALDLTVDPLVLVGTGARAAQLAARVVKPGEREAVLAIARGEEAGNVSGSTLRKGNKLQSLFHRTDNMSASQIANLPEFRKSGDAGALAAMFESANREFAGDLATRHAAKAELFGAALGDTKAIRAVKDRSTQMAEEIRRFGEPPITTAAYQQYSGTDFGAKMIQAWQLDDVDAVKAILASHETDLLNLQRVADARATTSTIAAGPLEKLSAAGRAEKVSGAFADRMTESFVPNALGGLPTRMVVGAASTRVPGSVALKDASRGYADLSGVVSRMAHTPAAERQAIMDDFVKAPTEEARRQVVEAAEEKIFIDAAKKYKISVPAAKKFLDQANARRGAYNKALSGRLYSTADTDDVVHFIDPEDGVRHVYKKAFLQTHIEDHHMITDPKVVDKFLKAGTNRRMLERWASNADETPGRLTGKAIAAQDLGAATRDQLDHWGTMVTRAWKDAALMRIAYPMRIQVDTQLRVMAHIGMQKWFLDGKFTSMGRHLLSDSDGQYSLRNILKEGSYEKSLDKQLRKGTTVRGVSTAPAQDAEDVQKIVASFASHGGVSADLGNDLSARELRQMRKDGDWGKVKYNDPKWFNAYKRAVDQIRTSPTARRALENDDIEALSAEVRANPKMMREWKNFEKTSDSLEEWLARVVNHNNHLLPTTELRSSIANPAAMQSMFDYEARATREAAAVGFKQTAAEGRAGREDFKDLIKSKEAEALTVKQGAKDLIAQVKAEKARLTADWKAAKPRSQARRDLRTQIRALDDPKVIREEMKDELAMLKEDHQTLKVQREQAQIQNKLGKADAKEALRKRKTGEVAPSGRPEPMDVHGESLNPLKRNSIAERWEDFRHSWYTFAADAPETIMGRSPIYVDAFQRYVKESVARLDDEGLDLVGADAIRASADKAARKEVANILFDATHTSNLAHGMRFIAPFFSAWEDTMKKWGKLMANDPSLPPTFAKVWQSPESVGFTVDSEGRPLAPGQKAENGRGEYIIIPKIKGLERIIPGNKDSKGKDAGMFKIRKDNLNILFQGNPPYLPGMGPLVQVPANEIVRRHFIKEADNPVLKYLLPFGVTDDPVAYQALPSWVKQVVDSGVGPFGTTENFNQQYVLLYNQEMGAYQRGERKSEPSDKEIGNKTKQWFLLRAALNNASPVSIQPVPKDQFYIDKAHQYRKEQFEDHTRKDWQQDFYDDFPEYFEMSSTLSFNETGLQATNDAYDASQKYKADIAKNVKLGWFFAGNDNLTGEFNPNINTYQRSTDAARGTRYRSLKDPMQAISDAEEQKGWMEFNKVSTAINLELKRRGLTSIQQKGAEDLAEAKRNYVGQLAEYNAPWGLAYGPGKAEQRRAELVSVAKDKWSKDKEFASRPDQEYLKAYLDARTEMQKLLATRKTSTLSSEENQDLAEAWGSYTQQLVEGNIAFEQIFNRAFESDDLSQVFK